MNGLFAHVLERVRTSYWLLPGLMTVGAIGLAELMLQADQARPDMLVAATSWLAVPGAEGSRAVLATIAGSMVTVAATVFSITMLTLSSASQQFGPRVLRNFMRDHWNQMTLGTVTGTFVYALLVLRTAGRSKGDEFVPHLSVSVAMGLALLAVGVLVIFIHHVSTNIQAPQIVARIARDLGNQIETFFPDPIGEPADEPPSSAIPPEAPFECRFNASGYIDAISDAPLQEAEQHGLTVRLLVRAGDFVTVGELCAHVWPAQSVTQEIESGIV